MSLISQRSFSFTYLIMDERRYLTIADFYRAEPHRFNIDVVPTVFDDAGNAYKRFGDGSYVCWAQPVYHEVFNSIYRLIGV